MSVRDKGLGRRVPENFDHVKKYPYRAVEPRTAGVVNRICTLPWWHHSHDQGNTGSCVGHGCAFERAVVNTRQDVLGKLPLPTRRYNPLQVWNDAKAIDEWSDTNPGDDNGTSVHAGYDVLRTKGIQRVKTMKLDESDVPYPTWPKSGPYPVDSEAGVAANRWATSIDEMRTAIAFFAPVTIGINWYEGFYPESLQTKKGLFGRDEYYIPTTNLGSVAGGHCVTIYGASDRRQAFKLKNSWGRYYPEVWLPYTVMERLLNEDGEAAIVTDR